MKSNLRRSFLALILALIMSLSFSPAFALASPDNDCTAPVLVKDVIEALYSLDGEPEMIENLNIDEPSATCKKDAAAWADAYSILPYGLSMDDEISQSEMASVMFHYAQHHDVDITQNSISPYLNESILSEEDATAASWAISTGLISLGSDGSFHPDETISTDNLSDILTTYRHTDFDTVGTVSDGLTLLYPSDEMSTISPLCDFYVIGDIDRTINVPDDARLTVHVTNSDGDVIREIYADIKDNLDGMYVDYPELQVTGDREAFRASMMPDLVYDPDNPSSFENTWIKACYSDEHYTSVVYGGSYRQDINPVDQFGQTLQPIPEGDYDLSVTLSDGNTTLASLSKQITIGIMQKKAITRFSPSSYKAEVEKYCGEHGIVIFSDPYPGNWDTRNYMPTWGNFTGEILKRWVLVDREGYIGGMTYFFDYNISQSSISYRVELGQLGYDKVLDDVDSITYCYFDIGEPVIKQHRNTYTGKFVEKDLNQMDPVVFTRADYGSVATPENYVSPSILSETTSQFDLVKRFVVDVGDTVSLNGICEVIQPETVTFLPETESFAMGNRIAGIRYTLRTATGVILKVIDKEVPGLQREFEEGYSSTSIVEFRHNFTVEESMRGNDIVILAEALDEYGNIIGGTIPGCIFRVPRS